MDKDKLEKLLHYADKPLNKFIQYDVFIDVLHGDDIVVPDEDGDAMFAGVTHELMSGMTNIRVLIKPNTSRTDAIRALKKIVNWIVRDGVFKEESFSIQSGKRVISDEECRDFVWAAGGTNEAIERIERMRNAQPPDIFLPGFFE